MRFSFALAVLIVAVAAVSAGVYPVKTGGGKGTSGHSKGGAHENAAEDDRFHMQSDDGQYVFGHTTGTQGRAEVRDKDGTVTGYYSYVGGNGKVIYVNYVADKKGYRVLSNTGVPSASVTIEGEAETKGPHAEKDFLKVFSDFTKRIKDKVVKQSGQEAVDLGDGQHQIDVVDPAEVNPAKETKPINNEEKNQFPDWNQVKIPSTPNPTDGIKIDEGQQQQETVDSNLEDNVTTQKANIKGHDYDGQGSINNDQNSVVATTETATKNAPSYPDQPQVPARGDQKGEFSDTTTAHEEYIQEITTEMGNSARVGTEPSVFTDDAGNSSPVTRPVESIVDDGQTTISYNDVPEKLTTEGSMINREDFQTTMAGVKQFEESSTAAAEATVSESATENNQIVKEIEEKIKTPIETDVVLTTGKPLDKESFENGPVVTENPSDRSDFKTTDAVASNVDFTTITTTVDEKVTVITNSDSTESPAVYESKATTFQPEIKIGDVETTTAGVRSVTEENKDDDFDFRTLEPTDVIGTTSSPDHGQSEAQEVQDIAWPEVPQVPAVPQVLVPLNPYSENSGIKNAVVKSHTANSRLVRNFNFNADVVKAMTVNSSEINTTTPTSALIDEDSTMFYPKYFIIG